MADELADGRQRDGLSRSSGVVGPARRPLRATVSLSGVAGVCALHTKAPLPKEGQPPKYRNGGAECQTPGTPCADRFAVRPVARITNDSPLAAFQMPL